MKNTIKISHGMKNFTPLYFPLCSLSALRLRPELLNKKFRRLINYSLNLAVIISLES